MREYKKENKIKFFLNYEGREDVYIIKKADCYGFNNYYNDYLMGGYIYDASNVFDSLESAIDSLKYTSKKIIVK